MSKHTPGPWIMVKKNNHIGIDCARSRGSIDLVPSGYFIAEIRDRRHGAKRGQAVTYSRKPVDEANARLIAAAPELLRELKWCIAALKSKNIGSGDPDYMNVIESAEAAIAKATEESE